MTGPTLYVLIGTAGSGKSTRAQHLARHLGAAYLDKDTMSSRFVEAALASAGYDPGDRESNDYYLTSLLPLEYDCLLDMAGRNLRLRNDVVVDAPFSPYLGDPEFMTRARERFDWPEDTTVRVLQIRVAPELLQERLRARGLARDHVKLANWDAYWAEHGNVTCAWQGVVLAETYKDTDNDDDLDDDSVLLAPFTTLS